MRRALIIVALLALALGACIDFEEAERQYCATHALCSDGGTRADAGP